MARSGAEHGTHAFYSWHGARHGAVYENGVKKLYEGFEYWYDTISEDERREIVEAEYWNDPEAVRLFKQRATPQEIEAFETGPFRARHFLVSSTYPTH